MVPNVVGKTLAQATRALTARHCKLGTVSRVTSRLRKKGHVVRESPAAGRHLRNSAKVNLWLGKGPAKRH